MLAAIDSNDSALIAAPARPRPFRHSGRIAQAALAETLDKVAINIKFRDRVSRGIADENLAARRDQNFCRPRQPAFPPIVIAEARFRLAERIDPQHAIEFMIGEKKLALIGEPNRRRIAKLQ